MNEWSIKDFVLLQFTILGVIVTLVSITSSLTKEVRQDLIIKYMLRRIGVEWFILYFISSFLIVSVLYFFEINYLGCVIFGFVGLSFVTSFIFVVFYIYNLRREKFYDILLKKFKKEVKTAKEIYIPKSILNYSRTQYESLEALIKNISYIEKNNSDFIEEVKILRKILEYCNEKEKTTYLIEFFDKDVIRIKNSSFLEMVILMFNELLYDLYKKSDEIESLKLAKLYQDRVYKITINIFNITKNFVNSTDVLGLYLKEFFSTAFLEGIEKTKFEKYIENFGALISNTINKLYELNKYILNLDLDNNVKKKYLLSQLSYLNNLLEFYNYKYPQNFYSDYYNGNADEKEKGLADKKLEIIKEKKKELKKVQNVLLYLILYKIGTDEIPKDFFEIAIRIFNLKDFDKQYYKYVTVDDFEFKNYDFFSGGVQVISRFNYNKYRLIIIFYNYLKTDDIDIMEFEKENFSDGDHKFENELNNLKEKFVSKYFEFEKKKFEDFKVLILKKIEEKKKMIEKGKQEHIIKQPLEQKYIDIFKKDCLKEWEKLQEEIKRFMEITPIDGGNNLKIYYGIYSLYGKKWFIESLDETISYDRSSGEKFGWDQTRNKLENILNLIDKQFDSQKDKEIIVKDLYSDLQDIIKEENEEYCLFYDHNQLNVYDLPNMNWNSRGYEEARTTINNSTIHFYHSSIPINLLFKKDSFVLKQYKQGYGKTDMLLVVEIEEITDKKQIERLLKKNPKFKTADDVKENVTIRIAEKFEVERKEDAVLVRLKV